MRAIKYYDPMACGIYASDEGRFVDDFLAAMSPYECLILDVMTDKSLTRDLRIRAGCDVE